MAPKQLKALIDEREQLLAWMETAKAREMEIRKALADHYFKSPDEGVNTVKDLACGATIKGTYKFNHKVDIAVLTSIRAMLPPGVEDRCINYDPKLRLKEFKELKITNEKAALMLSRAIISTPGTPSLEITKHATTD